MARHPGRRSHLNAGAYGGEMKDVIKWVSILDEDGKKKFLKRKNWLGISNQHNTKH